MACSTSRSGVASRAALRIVLALAALCSWSPSASAQTSPGDADALFAEGRRAAQAGDYDRACASFAASLALDRAAGTLLNLADCEERRGRLAEAQRLFVAGKEALDPGDERHAYVARRLASLAARLPETPKAAPAVVAAKPADEPPPPAPRQTVIVPAETEGRGAPVLGIALLAGAGAGAVVAGVTFALAADRKSTVLERCDEARLCDAAGAQAAREGSTFVTAATIATAAAGALGAAGVYFVLRSGKGGEARATAQLRGPFLSLEGSF